MPKVEIEEPLKPSIELDLPDWMKGRPLKDVTLSLTLNDIPEPQEENIKCLECDGVMEKSLTRYLEAGEIVVRASGPGYRCPNDGIEYLSQKTRIEFLQKAYELLIENGDHNRAKMTKSQLENEKKYLTTS